MSFSADVQARVPATLLIELTNKGTTGPNKVLVQAVLDAAIADASAEFEEWTGLEADDTEPLHTMAIVPGVLCFLYSYSGEAPEPEREQRRRWEDRLRAIARTKGAQRKILPASTSRLLPSTPLQDVQPDQDRTRWADVVPNMPGGDAEDFTGRGGNGE